MGGFFKRMFWKKKKLDSEEYLALFRIINELKLKLETLDLEFKLYKKKIRSKAGLDQEKEDQTKDIYSGMLLPE